MRGGQSGYPSYIVYARESSDGRGLEADNGGWKSATGKSGSCGTAELRERPSTQITQIRPLTRATQMSVDLHSRLLTLDSLKGERRREATVSRGSSQRTRLVAGRTFEVICGIFAEARVARPAICAHLRSKAVP